MDIIKTIYRIIRQDKLSKEIIFKIAFYGPGLSGKYTNLEVLHNCIDASQKSKIMTYPLENTHIITFDFNPSIMIDNTKVRFKFMTKIGHTYSKLGELEVLKDVSGVIFVADSQIIRMYANEEQLYSLKTNLNELKYNYCDIPMIIQLNKRDLPEIEKVDLMIKLLKDRDDIMCFETIAYKGVNILESIKEIMKQVINKYKILHHLL